MRTTRSKSESGSRNHWLHREVLPINRGAGLSTISRGSTTPLAIVKEISRCFAQATQWNDHFGQQTF